MDHSDLPGTEAISRTQHFECYAPDDAVTLPLSFPPNLQEKSTSVL